MRRNRQCILVLSETSTSFTTTCIIDHERHDTLRDAVIRTDPAPGFVCLAQDKLLQQHRITVEIGHIKNVNKNPVAKKGVQEVEDELIRLDPLGGPVTALNLSIATANLNARIRSRGLSAREMWYHRDQCTNQQIPIPDQQLIQSQYQLRKSNHIHSECSKAPHNQSSTSPQVDVGDLVYLRSDHDKSRARNRYLVTSVDGIWCNIRKFIGSQLRNASYRVKKSECFVVPTQLQNTPHPQRGRIDDYVSDDEIPVEKRPHPPVPPRIPTELSTPASSSENTESAVQPSDIVTVTQESQPQCPDIQAGTTTPPKATDAGPTTLSNGPALNGLRRSERHRQPPSHLKDFVMDY